MRRILLLLVSFALAFSPISRVIAQSSDPSDLFLNAYMSVQEGERLEHDGNMKSALSKYRYAASLLDQIQQKYPSWQPLIVDYRKKRTTENITRIEQQAGTQAPTTEQRSTAVVEPETPLPQRDTQAPMTVAPSPRGTPDDMANSIKGQIDQLQSELRESKAQLRAVQQEKAQLAGQLDEAMRQLDRNKVSVAELKAKLQQTQEAFQNAQADTANDSNSRAAMQKQIAQLQDQLADAQAEREAADEVNSDYARRLSKVRKTAEAVTKEREVANAKVADLESKYAEAAKTAKQLEQAKNQIAKLTADAQTAHQSSDNISKQLADAQKQLAGISKDRDAARKQADEANKKISNVATERDAIAKEREIANAKLKDLEAKFADASKLAQQLEDAKNQIAKLTADNQSAHQSGDEVAKKFADAQKQLASISKDRDAARKQADELNKRVIDAQVQIAAVTNERDTIAKQRDEALGELAKAREAQKKVDQLIADNSALAQKLATAEQTIKDFKSDTPKKDEEIANLRKEVGETKALLTATQKQNSDFKNSIADLQKQLDSANTQAAQMQASGATAEEKKKFAEENDLLRGIVLRQLKEQARREQARKLVVSELQRLQVQSNSLMQQIDYLGQPVVKLTDKEKALFKQPQIEIADTDANSMEFSIAAPKPETASSLATALVQQTKAAEPKALPSASPVQMAKLSSAAPSPSATSTVTPAKQSEDSLPSKDGSDANALSSPQVETSLTPNVPTDLLTQAHDAKDRFDRGDYREAEKIYDKMLTTAPNNVYILSNLGVVEFRQKKMKLAEEKFKKAIAVAPEDSFSHRTLGIVFYQEGKFDEAVNSLTRAIAINPKDAIAHNYLGITASQKGWQEAAMKELETAIALDPNYADANFNLAVIYATMQPPNKEAAHKYYKRATDLGAEPDSALEQLIK